MGVTAKIHGKKASFLEMAVARKKKKKAILGANQERVTLRMNQKMTNWNQKRNQKNNMIMRRIEEEKTPRRTQTLPGVRRVL